MAKPTFIKKSFSLLKETFLNFRRDKVMKMSAALAYYTIFSLPAFFLIIISVTGVFFGQEASSGGIFQQLNDLIGVEAAAQVQTAIENIHLSGKSYIGTLVGGIMLVLSAGAIFGEIQDSINVIWGLKAKPRRGLLKMLLNRLLSFSLVIGLGFVSLVTLIINGILLAVRGKLEGIFPDMGVYLLFAVDYALQLVTITFLFGVIFKVLPDAKIKWQDVAKGAAFTSVLFLLGKFVISYFISKNTVTQAYGAAGSVLILLLWVYYSALILYLGAEFTRAYAMRYGNKIKPNKYAVWTEVQVTEITDPETTQKEKV